MRPTVAELLQGVADALESDAVPAIGDLTARNQVQSAVGILRRVARLLPELHRNLVADSDDIALALHRIVADLSPAVRVDIATALRAHRVMDPAHAGLDELQLVHHGLLDALDSAVRDEGATRPHIDAVLRAVLVHITDRERTIGASIAAR